MKTPGRKSPHPPGRLLGAVLAAALTTSAMQGDREKFLAAGMDDYVSKPVRLPELQAAIERWACGPFRQRDNLCQV